MTSRIIIIIFAIVSLYIYSNREGYWRNTIYDYDTFNYHLYLPSAIIHNDLKTISCQPDLNKAYNATNQEWYCIESFSNGNRVNRYSIGLALHEAPFFIIAHYYTTHFPTIFVADGCSVPYQYASIASNIFWVVLGLFILRRFLKQYFNDKITTVTLLAIAFGTNLYHYTVFLPGMSHPYSFMHFAWVLLLTSKLYEHKKSRHFYLLAFSLGCIALIRPSNLVVGIIPLLWGVNNFSTLKARFLFLSRKYKPILISLIIFALTILPQLLYWHTTTGSWIYDGYSEEGFIWSEPKLFDGLLGFRKGWFIYTPIAFISMVGLFFLRGKLKAQRVVLSIFLITNIYIIFSWWNWWYGAGFGCRALVESTAVLAIPFASFTQLVLNKKQVIIKALYLTLVSLLVALNMFQSYQYAIHIIHYDSMTYKYYKKVFFKTERNIPEELELINPEEYYPEHMYRINKAKPK